jgi:hypothetical protein
VISRACAAASRRGKGSALPAKSQVPSGTRSANRAGKNVKNEECDGNDRDQRVFARQTNLKKQFGG